MTEEEKAVHQETIKLLSEEGIPVLVQKYETLLLAARVAHEHIRHWECSDEENSPEVVSRLCDARKKLDEALWPWSKGR